MVEDKYVTRRGNMGQEKGLQTDRGHRYVGLMLAVSSSLAIGASFVITKKGLNASIEKHGFNGDGFGYLQNPVWWAGITTSERARAHTVNHPKLQG